jgi:photosystem II stability/assembly factor-like uncharacterized protein
MFGAHGSAAPAPAALPEALGRAATASRLARNSALLTATRTDSRLLAAGERGTVLWSDDHGEQWTQARVPGQMSITALAFGNAREGWAAGHFGVLLRTQDGGQSWTFAMDGIQAAQLLQRSATTDAQRQAAQRQVEQGADKPLFDIALSEGGLLAVGAYGMALHRRAGDGSFEAIGSKLPNPRQLHLYAVRARGRHAYIAGEQGLLLRSTDGADRFEPLPSPYKGSFFGLELLGDSTVLAYGLRGNIWRSTDHGESWKKIPSPLPVNLSSATRLNDGGLVLLAQNGDLLISRDEGLTFAHTPATEPFPAAALVAAADGNHLVFGGLRGLKRQTLASILTP